jgi:type VII secretion protein EccB
MAGFRLTTKVQVSGWRFLLRRVEHAIVRRDTRMFDDPLQFYSRAVSAGLVIAVLVCLGALMMAYFKPLGTRGGDTLLVDRTTNELFVLMPGSGKLHPVYNLTSARLVLGHASEPVAVKSQELDRMQKGQPIGIPGAPYATPVASGSTSTWTLCDTVVKPESVAPTVQTSVIAEPLATGPSVGPLRDADGVVVRYNDGQWLITKDGRHAVDLSDRAVASAVGIPVTVTAAPISRALFNAIRDAGPWGLPPIANAGAPNNVGLPPNLVIGSVFQAVTGSAAGSGSQQSYVVLEGGVAKVNPTTASALRATNSYGLVAPPVVESSTVADIAELVYASPLPANAMNIVDRVADPVLCWSWMRQAGDQNPVISIISGRHLPLPPAALNSGIDQVTGDNTVYVNGGQFIRLQAPDPRAGESMYYIDPQGVRYGIPNPQVAGDLGLSSPQNAPWQVVNLLVDGPVLSKESALLEHDTLPPDPDPRKVQANQGGGS